MNTPRSRHLSRILDAMVAAVGLTVAMPMLIVLALLISLNSKGAPIFVQPRIGKNGKTFNCYKLRTMHSGTTVEATHLVSKNQITTVGAMLRKYKLDELPQLFNVLRGDMAIVGPRPCLVTQFELISIRNEFDVFSVQPGITGLAQVRGVDMSDTRKLALMDREYIDKSSILLDVKILWATVRGEGFRDYVK